MPALLEAKGLHAAYGETKVLHGIDFAVEEGGVTALLGANGAGKTTTLRMIGGPNFSAVSHTGEWRVSMLNSCDSANEGMPRMVPSSAPAMVPE